MLQRAIHHFGRFKSCRSSRPWLTLVAFSRARALTTSIARTLKDPGTQSSETWRQHLQVLQSAEKQQDTPENAKFLAATEGWCKGGLHCRSIQLKFLVALMLKSKLTEGTGAVLACVSERMSDGQLGDEEGVWMALAPTQASTFPDSVRKGKGAESLGQKVICLIKFRNVVLLKGKSATEVGLPLCLCAFRVCASVRPQCEHQIRVSCSCAQCLLVIPCLHVSHKPA